MKTSSLKTPNMSSWFQIDIICFNIFPTDSKMIFIYLQKVLEKKWKIVQADLFFLWF